MHFSIPDPLNVSAEQYAILRGSIEYRVRRAFPNLSREEVEDAVSEAVLWLRNRNPKQEITNLRAYAVVIALNKAHHGLRQKRRREMYASELIQAITDSDNEYGENRVKMLADSIIEAADDLPPLLACVFVPYYFQGCGLHTIADQLKISHDCAKQRLTRARDFVKRHPCVRDNA